MAFDVHRAPHGGTVFAGHVGGYLIAQQQAPGRNDNAGAARYVNSKEDKEMVIQFRINQNKFAKNQDKLELNWSVIY